jgi:hypothetical protein
MAFHRRPKGDHPFVWIAGIIIGNAVYILFYRPEKSNRLPIFRYVFSSWYILL